MFLWHIRQTRRSYFSWGILFLETKILYRHYWPELSALSCQKQLSSVFVFCLFCLLVLNFRISPSWRAPCSDYVPFNKLSPSLLCLGPALPKHLVNLQLSVFWPRTPECAPPWCFFLPTVVWWLCCSCLTSLPCQSTQTHHGSSPLSLLILVEAAGRGAGNTMAF